MGGVVEFPRVCWRPRPAPPPPRCPLRALELWGGYYDPSNWRVSRKDNPFVRIAGRPVTLFRHAGGWRWSIGRSAREGPLFSDETYVLEPEARSAAWDALWDMVFAEHRWFMNPLNWETVEKNGYRRCIEIAPHGVILQPPKRRLVAMGPLSERPLAAA